MENVLSLYTEMILIVHSAGINQLKKIFLCKIKIQTILKETDAMVDPDDGGCTLNLKRGCEERSPDFEGDLQFPLCPLTFWEIDVAPI